MGGGYAKNCHLEADIAFIVTIRSKIHKNKRRTSNTGSPCLTRLVLQQVDAEDAGERLREKVVQPYKNKEFYPTYVKFAQRQLQRNEECDKPTVEGLEQYKRRLRAVYLQAVSVIDENLELLRNQLEDESISETRHGG